VSSSASSNSLLLSGQEGGSSSTGTVYQDETGAVMLDELELSIGSRGYGTNDCTPCFFSRRRAGCQNGSDCKFCHLPHQREHKFRPSKGKRDRFHKQLESMHKDLDDNAKTILNDPNWLDHVASRLPPFVHKQPALKFRVLETLGKHAERLLLSKELEPDLLAGPPQSTDPSSSCDMHRSHSEHVQGRQFMNASDGKACFKTSL